MCRRLLVVLAVLVVAGCPRAEFRVDDMQSKQLLTAYDTLDYFRTAMRARDWDAVYETLSAETKKYIDDKFLGKMGFGRYAETRTLGDIDPHAAEPVKDMLVVELLHRARTLNVIVDDVKHRATVYLLYEYPGGKLLEPFVLVEEKDPKGVYHWRVGIQEWLDLRMQK